MLFEWSCIRSSSGLHISSLWFPEWSACKFLHFREGFGSGIIIPPSTFVPMPIIYVFKWCKKIIWTVFLLNIGIKKLESPPNVRIQKRILLFLRVGSGNSQLGYATCVFGVAKIHIYIDKYTVFVERMFCSKKYSYFFNNKNVEISPTRK